MFTPRREHARFCSAACRVAWNREHTGNPQAGASALDWSVTAMHDAVERLLVRYHHRAYEAVMRAQDPAARQAVEGTLAGLRFVRNRMGYHADPAEFIQPGHGRPGSGNGAAAWRWRSLPEPALASLPPRGRAWEITRYRAYQAQLAGHTIGETFGRAAAFLKLASANPTAALPVGPRSDDS